MLMQSFKQFWLLSVTLLVLFIIAGCSSSSELSKNESKKFKKKGVDEYNNSTELVATNTLKEKSSINKGSLESISSSIAGFMDSPEFSSSVDKDEVMYKVIEYLNTPYRYGGNSKSGIDCSAFVQTVMYQALGVSIPRTSYDQSNVGEDVSLEDLKFGDLVFFNTRGRGRVSHVGIYLSDGYFVHSGSRTGVAIASLNSDYYSRTFLKAKRVTE
jgi:cell wall-associated NlpC family hydrolase